MEKPSESLTYALVQLAKRHRGIVAAGLRELGLHVGQELLLLELFDTDSLSQAELADRLDVEQPTVAKAVRRMQAAGLVDRHRDPHDARVQRVRLTDMGRDLRRPIERLWADAEAQLLAALTGPERRQLRTLFETIHKENEQ